MWSADLLMKPGPKFETIRSGGRETFTRGCWKNWQLTLRRDFEAFSARN
jgi:hypothetical protein